MSNKISRRAFLKCAGVSAAAVGSASLLSGCKTNGRNTTVNDVKVGDTVKNWNGLGVQLSSVFHLTQDPAQPGYEYLGVRVTVLNRSKTETYTIGAQGVDAINAALDELREEYRLSLSGTEYGSQCLFYPSTTDRYLNLVFFQKAADYGNDCTTPTPRASPTARACPRRAPATSC